LAVLLLPISGVAMLDSRFAGFAAAPQYVQIMMGLYLAMLALFLRVQLLQLPQLRQAVSREDWSAGADALGKIRRLVGLNLCLGLALVVIAAARPSF
jgi:uncharacterized membrane protein